MAKICVSLCASCGQRHSNIQVHKAKSALEIGGGYFRYYIICPQNKDVVWVVYGGK